MAFVQRDDSRDGPVVPVAEPKLGKLDGCFNKVGMGCFLLLIVLLVAMGSCRKRPSDLLELVLPSKVSQSEVGEEFDQLFAEARTTDTGDADRAFFQS